MNQAVLHKHSLGEQVVDLIRGRIISGYYVQGDRINPKKLAQELDISPAPARDALMHLSAHGLVMVKPYKGFFCVSLEDTDIANLYDLRILFESHALETANPLTLRKQLLGLWQVFSTFAEQGGNQDTSEDFYTADRQFHAVILNLCPNPLLKESAAHITDIVELTRHLNMRAVQSSKEHLQIIDTVAKGDLIKARQYLISHLDNVRRELLARYTEGGDRVRSKDRVLVIPGNSD